MAATQRIEGFQTLRLPYRASNEAAAAIAEVGRTEDVQYSPDGRRMAIAGFVNNTILILEAANEGGGRVSFSGKQVLTSPAFNHPHGISWIDDTTLVVANRAGGVPIVRVPPAAQIGETRAAEILQVIETGPLDQLEAPGSVVVSRMDDGLIDIIICDNALHHVTRHLVDAGDGYRVVASEVLVAAGLNIPDGLAISPTREWLAVSNHYGQNVHLYRYQGESADRAREPEGILRGVEYPHGLKFTPDGRHLLVADAGAPLVLVYASPDGDWTGDRVPVTAIEVLDEPTFIRGRTMPDGTLNPEEGGPKGIELSADGRVLIITCDEVPMAMFDLAQVLEAGPAQRATPVAAEMVRKQLLERLGAARQELGAGRGELDRRRSGAEMLQREVWAARDVAAAVSGEIDAMRREIGGLSERISQGEGRDNEAQARDAVIGGELAALRQEVGNLGGYLQQIADNASASAALNEMVGSTSWRLTAPLRAVSRLLNGKR